jgi:hypothetical protein
MLEQKTTTNEEFEALCAALLPKFNEYLMRHSKNIFSCELATSLDGIKTMPALYDLDGVQKQVIAPLSLLTKDVDAEIAACKKATKEATTAAAKANDAAASVTKATTDLSAERKKVEDAVNSSITQTAAAKKATDDTLASKAAIEQNETARQTAEQTRQTQETARQTAESTRNSNETTRKNQEATRVTQENTRQSNETTRNSNEETRKKQESTRQSQEAARVEAEKKRVTAENGRASAETSRVNAEIKRKEDTKTAIANSKTQTDLAKELNEHPQMQGENGNWWKWNTETKEYEDTGIIARGGMMYPTFEIFDNELYVTDAGSNIEERIALEDNELILKL